MIEVCKSKVQVNAKYAQHSVHLIGVTRRVFKQASWLKAGSVKVAVSRPAHQPVTRAVSLLQETYFLKTAKESKK